MKTQVEAPQPLLNKPPSTAIHTLSITFLWATSAPHFLIAPGFAPMVAFMKRGAHQGQAPAHLATARPCRPVGEMFWGPAGPSPLPHRLRTSPAARLPRACLTGQQALRYSTRLCSLMASSGRLLPYSPHTLPAIKLYQGAPPLSLAPNLPTSMPHPSPISCTCPWVFRHGVHVPPAQIFKHRPLLQGSLWPSASAAHAAALEAAAAAFSPLKAHLDCCTAFFIGQSTHCVPRAEPRAAAGCRRCPITFKGLAGAPRHATAYLASLLPPMRFIHVVHA
jgi:hypothetical protein